jgi:hypothetical protein
MAASPREDVIKGGRTTEEIAGDDAFERLYSNWLAARANLYNPDEAPSSMDSRLDRVSEAATALLVTPSSLPWMIWQKWEVLEDYLDTEKQDGVCFPTIGRWWRWPASRPT